MIKDALKQGPLDVTIVLLPESSIMSLASVLCMLALGGISTSIAYWLWGRLLHDYPAAQVVPFALLVPFVGSAASSVAFGERFGPLRLSGMLTAIGGIGIMVLGQRRQAAVKSA